MSVIHPHRRTLRGNLLVSLLIVLFVAPTVQSAELRVRFRLELTAHETSAGTEIYSAPLPAGELTLVFDPTWNSTETTGDAMGVVKVHMAGNSTFTSSITPQLPWAPPGGLSDVTRQSEATLTNVTTEQYSVMSFFDYHFALSGESEYHYLISLDSDAPGNSNPFIENIQDYRTPELIAYLQAQMANQEPLALSEWAFILDTATETYIAWDDFKARAYITAIEGDGVIPPPDAQQVPLASTPLLLLLFGLLGNLGLAQSRGVQHRNGARS